MNIQTSRILHHALTSNTAFTVPSQDVDISVWNITDLANREIGINLYTSKAFFRSNTDIIYLFEQNNFSINNQSCTNTGQFNILMGDTITCSTNHNLLMGANYTISTGANNIINGSNLTINGSYNLIIGSQISSDTNYSIIVGANITNGNTNVIEHGHKFSGFNGSVGIFCYGASFTGVSSAVLKNVSNVNYVIQNTDYYAVRILIVAVDTVSADIAQYSGTAVIKNGSLISTTINEDNSSGTLTGVLNYTLTMNTNQIECNVANSNSSLSIKTTARFDFVRVN